LQISNIGVVMKLQRYIYSTLLVLVLLFMGCFQSKVEGDFSKYIGTYSRAQKNLDIYELDNRLYLRVGEGESWQIKPGKRGKFSCDHIFGEFLSSGDNYFKMVMIDGTLWNRFSYNGDEVTIPLRQGLSPVSLVGEALSKEMPKELSKGKVESFSELEISENRFLIKLQLADKGNPFGYEFYESNKAFLCSTPAAALRKAQQELKEHGFGIVIRDAYRPWFVTWLMWNSVENPLKSKLENPNDGSIFNRGVSVDLSLYKLDSGESVNMVSEFGDFSYRSTPEYIGGSSLERINRTLLSSVMQKNGFIQDSKRWWHFDYKDYKDYAFRNESFSELSVSIKK